MTQNLFDLSKRVAVVIGGTTGLGHAIGLGLAEAGADVVATSRRIEQVEKISEEIAALGRRTLRVPCDVSERNSVQKLHDAVLAEFGKVDILINAAGVTHMAPMLEIEVADWSQVMDTNLTGTLRACQIFAPSMVRAGYGRVSAYSASKAAVASLTRSLAVELARSGVNVNAIAPGIFPTPLNASLIQGTARGDELLMRTPMGRFGEAQELVGAAVYLSSRASSFVTGTVLAVDGGFLASGVNQ